MILLLLSTHSHASGGESDLPAFGPSESLSIHLASIAVTPAGPVHKSSGAYVGAVEEMMCVLQSGHSGDDVFWRRLCVSVI